MDSLSSSLSRYGLAGVNFELFGTLGLFTTSWRMIWCGVEGRRGSGLLG